MCIQPKWSCITARVIPKYFISHNDQVDRLLTYNIEVDIRQCKLKVSFTLLFFKCTVLWRCIS